MNPAIVLHAPLPAAPVRLSWEEPLLRALPYARHLELGGRNAMQRRASLAGIALVLLGAERLVGRPYAARDFSFPLDQKPTLARGPEFSLSHTERRVACCITHGVPCGLDIEDLAPRAETENLERLRRWTATEALLKAAGLGIRDLRDVVLDASFASGSLSRTAGEACGEGSAPSPAPAGEGWGEGFGTVRGERFELQSLPEVPGTIGHVASRSKVLPTIVAVDLPGDELSAALERCFSLAAQLD